MSLISYVGTAFGMVASGGTALTHALIGDRKSRPVLSSGFSPAVITSVVDGSINTVKLFNAHSEEEKTNLENNIWADAGLFGLGGASMALKNVKAIGSMANVLAIAGTLYVPYETEQHAQGHDTLLMQAYHGVERAITGKCV